jgi:unsaturated chondroitin disaccharide hydrolase
MMRCARVQIACTAALSACAHWPAASPPSPLDLAARRYAAVAAALDPDGGHPRATTVSGVWQQTPAIEWTSGFFSGTLWYLYEYTRDPALRAQAERWTLPLADIPHGSYSHDLGFQFNSSFVNAFRLTGDERFRAQALNAAGLLAAHFNPTVGAIKSWDWMPPERPYPVIADNMMNLELLFWAARQPGGDAHWRDIAVQHAYTTLKHHLRDDGGSYHVVVFDPASGRVLERITHQGYADSTTWSRGQAWLLYGFTMAFRETGEPPFLESARRVADYFLAHLPADGVPCWDFQAPDCTDLAQRDASAAAIAASGLLELSRFAGAQYGAAAERIIGTLSSDYSAPRAAMSLLTHAVGNMPAGTEIDVGLSYADYYFVEALLRQQGALPPRTARVFTARPELLRISAERLRAGDPQLRRARAQLLADADSALRTGPFTVTAKERVPPSGDKRDYMSTGPYWWPDSTKPNGLPYVHRDGHVNWELRRDSDVLRWYALVDAVEKLAYAYYFTDREAYAERAALLLRTWFIDPASRMNPHLRYGQAIPGVVEGRGIGIIDTRDLGRVTDAIGLIETSPAWTTPDRAAVREWMATYVDWLTSSEHGRDEADKANNHGTWYDVQVVALSSFLGDTARARAVAGYARTTRIASQIDSAGRQPLELARTRSLHYSAENLDGMTRLAEMAHTVGVDLWHWQAPGGASLRKAIEFVAPYADSARTWPGEQITSEADDLFLPLLLRARHVYGDATYDELLTKLPESTRSHRAYLLYPVTR